MAVLHRLSNISYTNNNDQTMFITRMQIMPTINNYHNQIRENNTKYKGIYFYYMKRD